ncbi:MAG: EamA family transporter [Rhodospirillales bacterium]|nr:EamA family transporter [Rhodospirillales bacterium]
MAIEYLSLSLFTVMLAAGQVLFKTVGLALRREGVVAILRAPSLYAALVLYGAATLLWIWILSRVPLTRAYPWVSLGAILVPLAGWWWFGEGVTPRFWLGVGLIVAGMALTQAG